MRIAHPIFALLLSGSSVPVHSQGLFPASRARSLVEKVVRVAHSEVLARRKLQLEDTSGFDMGDNVITIPPAVICYGLEMDFVQALIASEMEALNFTCSEIGCDDPGAEIPNVIANCNLAGEFCEESETEQFCLADVEVKEKISLDFVGESQVTYTECGTYTSPDYMAEMGRGCWTADISLDIGSMVEDLTEEIMTGEEVVREDSAYFEMIGCSATFDDETECECEPCDEEDVGTIKIHFVCDNGQVSEECTTFDDGATIIMLTAMPGEGGNESDIPDTNTGTRMVDQILCSEEMTLYQDPLIYSEDNATEFKSDFDQFVIVKAQLFEDPDLEIPAMSADGICDSLGDGRFLCNIVTADELGTTTLTGICEPYTASTYVFTGGTGYYVGIIGKVTSELTHAGIIEHKVCIQAPST